VARRLTYHVAVEPAGETFSGHVLDLPCFASGSSPEQVIERLREAVEFYLEDFEVEGKPLPEPVSSTATVTVEVA
jgi:predicted RNase H-like HicB family nuclease